MKPEWKTCLRVGVSAFALFLCIHYWEPFTSLLALLARAAGPLLEAVLAGLVLALAAAAVLLAWFHRFEDGRADA